MKFLVLLLSFLLLGCALQPSSQVGFPAPSFGTWHNPYVGDPTLAAVAIMRGPANPFDKWGFASTRLTGLSFAFWDGRVRQVQFRGDGSVWDDFWWPPNARLRPGSAAWGGFEFMYGSDPTFATHRDPRLREPAPSDPAR